MIYIFSSCKEICKLPCTLCEYGCKCCKESCGAFCDLWAPICSNPLGGYVIITWCFMLPAIICAALGLGSAKDNESYVAIGDVVLGLVHAGFAFYLQRQLVNGLEKRGWQPGEGKSHKDIAKEAKTIAKYDVGFCLYFFVFVGAFGFNCWGATVVSDNLLAIAVGLMIAYGCFAWLYSTCWCCGQACFAGASYNRKKKGKGGGPEPDLVGQQEQA